MHLAWCSTALMCLHTAHGGQSVTLTVLQNVAMLISDNCAKDDASLLRNQPGRFVCLVGLRTAPVSTAAAAAAGVSRSMYYAQDHHGTAGGPPAE